MSDQMLHFFKCFTSAYGRQANRDDLCGINPVSIRAQSMQQHLNGPQIGQVAIWIDSILFRWIERVSIRFIPHWITSNLPLITHDN